MPTRGPQLTADFGPDRAPQSSDGIDTLPPSGPPPTALPAVHISGYEVLGEVGAEHGYGL